MIITRYTTHACSSHKQKTKNKKKTTKQNLKNKTKPFAKLRSFGTCVPFLSSGHAKRLSAEAPDRSVGWSAGTGRTDGTGAAEWDDEGWERTGQEGTGQDGTRKDGREVQVGQNGTGMGQDGAGQDGTEMR